MANSTSTFSTMVMGLEHAFLRDVQDTRSEDLVSAEATMMHVLLQLRRHLNTLVPVGRLPPELLTRIFLLCMQLSGHYVAHAIVQDGALPSAPTAPLLGLTHVCYRWRIISLNTPALWSQLDDRNSVQFNAALLSRSQSMPLSVIVDATRLNAMLECHAPRIARLTVIESDNLTSSTSSLALAHELPLLECITIDTMDWENDLKTSLMFFRNPVSHIKALALCHVSWSPGNQFPNLTHLYLDWSNFATSTIHGDSIYYLASLLSRTPALQSLHLVRMREDRIAETARIARPPPPIPLSSMRTVTCLRSRMTTAFYFLSLLELPDTALVHLDELDRIDIIGTYILPPPASSSLIAACSRAQLLLDDNYLIFLAETLQSGTVRIRGVMFEELTKDDYYWNPDSRPLVTCLNHVGILPFIRTLHLGATDSCGDTIPLLLCCMHSLESLTVLVEKGSWLGIPGPVHARAVYAALSDPAQCCPQLRSLVVLVRSSDPEDMCPTELLSMLQARRRCGLPLERLAVNQWRTSVTPSHEVAEDERKRWDKAFAAWFPRARQFVHTVEPAGGDDLRPFTMRETWEGAAGAEDYWDLSTDWNDIMEGGVMARSKTCQCEF